MVKMSGMVRFGILGFGLHAEKRLAPAFGHCRHARLVALSRRELKRAQASARRHDVPRAFASAEELCRCPEVDAILVATPNACHCADTLLALRHGKPVLCEKPMATSAAECSRMIAAAAQAKQPLGVAQVFRFHHVVVRLRERLAAGEIGQPVSARAEFAFPGKSARTWIYDRAQAGGGALADVGVHCIDALRFILQDEVVAVDARGLFDVASGDVEAASGLLLQFARSTLGSVFASYRSPYWTAIEIVGETGTLRAASAFSVEEPVRTELWRGRELVDTERTISADCFSRMLDAFALAVEVKQPFACPAEEGLKTQIVIDQAYAKLYQAGKGEGDKASASQQRRSAWLFQKS